MARNPVVIRDAESIDADALQKIWLDFAGEAGGASEARLDEIRRAIARVTTEPMERLLVGLVDGSLVGVAHLRQGPLSPLHDDDAVHVGYLHVLSGHRRRGVGTQLMHAAADWADLRQSNHIVASVAATARDANRFLARLGLGQVAIVRATTVTALRAKLALSNASTLAWRAADTRVLAARRMRRRAARASA